MFFSKEMVSLNLLDVLELKQTNVNTFNTGRNFCALSFRYRSDAVITTEETVCEMRDNCVAYFPERLNYKREASVDELIVVHFNISDSINSAIEFFEVQNSETLCEMFKTLLATWQGREIGYKYKCTSILYDILSECYRENFKVRHKGSKIRESVDYIQANFKDPELSIPDIAKKSFMSEVYFRKLFKKEYGISPQKYIVNLRIQNAAALISSGYYSLKDIAIMSGYTDYKYFTIEFKRCLGVSPSKYGYTFKYPDQK